MAQNRLIPEDVTPDKLTDFFNVSRESLDRIKAYVAELLRWQGSINLISPATVDQVWHRHVCDGLQLADYLSGRENQIVDLGSGCGVPGILLAIWLEQHNPGSEVVMIESNAKKAAFLNHACRVCRLSTRIINTRVESVEAVQLGQSADVCVARALAPLPALLELTARLPFRPQRMLFLKGQDVDAELTETTKCWNISFSKHSSRTQLKGCILDIKEAERVSKNHTASD